MFEDLDIFEDDIEPVEIDLTHEKVEDKEEINMTEARIEYEKYQKAQKELAEKPKTLITYA